jgi:glycosyltransferase involved in cell wall biosynthesis
MACFGLPLKIVQTTHEFDYNYSTLGKSMKWLSFKSADHNLFVSRTLCEYYILKYKLKKNDTTIIHNAVNFSKLGDPSKISIQSICNINKGVFKLGMVGNFVPGHDQATVCRFLSLLNEQNLNFNFLFIGAKDKNSPQFYDKCVDFCNKHGLNEKVVFTGSRSDVPELLSCLDLFIYSSNYDGFGIAVIEAIASGIPVFVNDLDVMKEITDNGKRAILFRTKDESDLMYKFMQFFEDQEILNYRAKENAAWAKRKFGIQLYIEKLHQVYRKVVNPFNIQI